jgi:hypothetical protein
VQAAANATGWATLTQEWGYSRRRHPWTRLVAVAPRSRADSGIHRRNLGPGLKDQTPSASTAANQIRSRQSGKTTPRTPSEIHARTSGKAVTGRDRQRVAALPSHTGTPTSRGATSSHKPRYGERDRKSRHHPVRQGRPSSHGGTHATPRSRVYHSSRSGKPARSGNKYAPPSRASKHRASHAKPRHSSYGSKSRPRASRRSHGRTAGTSHRGH